MSYNLKCCSFYPNNFDASALKNIRKLSYPDRDTHVPRSGYACTSVGVRMYFGRGTHVLRSGYACTSVGVRMYLGRGTMTMKHF